MLADEMGLGKTAQAISLLDHTNTLLNCMRNANTTIRWLMLHRTTEVKQRARRGLFWEG